MVSNIISKAFLVPTITVLSFGFVDRLGTSVNSAWENI